MTNVQHMTAIVGLELRALWLVTQSCCIMMLYLRPSHCVCVCLFAFACCRRVLVSLDTRASRLHVLCVLHSHGWLGLCVCTS